ncbi:MAG: ATP-grasp domain-containing protein [Alphaproteobacteria bacterium]|nr:ATP-grasp domain-containing protein [Alphaproteobacteria bacterium]
MPFRKILVANRGAAAARIIRALREMSIRSVAVYSEADADLPYLAEADEKHCIGPAAPKESYLDQPRILGVLDECGADGLHPGYGFLSENAQFARAVEAAGRTFIGPSPRLIDQMGHKARARAMLGRHGMPVSASSGVLEHNDLASRRAAEAIGYPVMVKPAGGGGGIGMSVANSPQEIDAAVTRARSAAMRSFGNDEIYLERYVRKPRHVEFQILGDRSGAVRHVFERDCSIQRRHQKVIEEARAPVLDPALLESGADRIVEAMSRIGYDGIGTVETLYDPDGGFGFLEVNTRLQVEHAVTEEIAGIDLVRCQILAAAGMPIGEILPARITLRGTAIQARIYAEDPIRFLPSPGPLSVFRGPTGAGIRFETGYAEGSTITPYYDPMIAKVIAHGPTRAEAIALLDAALEQTVVRGVKTNIAFIRAMLKHPAYVAGELHTGLAAELTASAEYRAEIAATQARLAAQ